MNMTGSSNVNEGEAKSFVDKIKAFRERYRAQTSIALAVIAALTFIAAEYAPVIQQFILTSGLLQYVTLIVVLDLATAVYIMQRPPTTRIARNQDESMPKLIEALSECRSDSVDLLEYAATTTLPLIRAIRRERVPVRMLVKHPETVGGLQRQRTIGTLEIIYDSIFDDYRGSFEVRCYRLPYGLRGRRLGKKLLELGWLTPDPKRQTTYGHANPGILADLSNTNNEHLRAFFDRTFDILWNDSETEDGKAVLERLKVSA